MNKIVSAKFIKGIVKTDPLLEDAKLQVAFIGRSNVGKSTVINTMTNQKSLAKSSAKAGKTQEINLFSINESFYFVDLPGYGFADASIAKRNEILKLIVWYLIEVNAHNQLIVIVVDAKVGLTEKDIEVLKLIENHKKEVIILANKIDKLNQSEKAKNLKEIEKIANGHKVIPFSSTAKIGVDKFMEVIFSYI